MRVLVVSDIHGNLNAFQAVLAHVRQSGPLDAVWCLGDIVGYGPEPGACVDLLASLPHVAVAGNHDLAATGAIGLERFNPLAAEAARWTARNLTPGQKAFLQKPLSTVEESPFTLVHGSPLDPVWDYFMPNSMEQERIKECFKVYRTPYCLVGQTHVPMACSERPLRFSRLTEAAPITLGVTRLVLNPGSVGQPRDGDPRASALVYEPQSHRVAAVRVPYDVGAVQERMLRAGLPRRLAARLSYGA